MTTTKSTKPQPGVYLIIIDGLPDQYTWQDLKDFVRPGAEHEFWADLTSIPTGSAQKRGCVRTQRPKEAVNLFNFLSVARINGRRLNIILWDASESPPRQIKSSNVAQARSDAQYRVPPNAPNGTASGQTIAPVQPTLQPLPYPQQQAALVNAMGGMSLGYRQAQAGYPIQQQQQQQQQKLAPPALQQQQYNVIGHYPESVQSPGRHDLPQAQQGASRPSPAYVKSRNGTEVNVQDGVALTVSQGIFVSGINFKAREDDIKHKFSSVGNVVSCQLRKDKPSGKSKGVATVLYSSSAEAQKAINRYHGATWMDKEIKVRFDTEPTVVSAPPRPDASPLIVNGSRTR